MPTVRHGRDDARSGFTTAYFHSPSELAGDFTAAGLGHPELFGTEGPLWAALDVAGAQLTDPLFAMACARAFETDPAIMGASAHLLATVRAGHTGLWEPHRGPGAGDTGP
jgi:hypothetical protein